MTEVHASLLNQASKNPFSHIEKCEIIFHNRYFRTLRLVSNFTVKKTSFQKGPSSPDTKKRNPKHGLSTVDMSLNLVPKFLK